MPETPPTTRFRFAVYDPGRPNADGAYWVYRHHELALPLLDRLYYDVLADQAATQLRGTECGDLVAGFATIGDWGCWYRFIECGRDAQGRPGRFSILCTVADRREIAGRDSSGVFKTTVAKDLEDMVRRQSSDRPRSLELAAILLPVSADPAHLVRLQRGLPVEITTGQVQQSMAGLCAHVAGGFDCRCVLQRRDGRLTTRIRFVPISSCEPSGAARQSGDHDAGQNRDANGHLLSGSVDASASKGWRNGLPFKPIALVLAVLICVVALLAPWKFRHVVNPASQVDVDGFSGTATSQLAPEADAIKAPAAELRTKATEGSVPQNQGDDHAINAANASPDVKLPTSSPSPTASGDSPSSGSG